MLLICLSSRMAQFAISYMSGLTAGLDTCLAIMRVLHEGLGDSKYRPCPLLVQYVDAGKAACSSCCECSLSLPLLPKAQASTDAMHMVYIGSIHHVVIKVCYNTAYIAGAAQLGAELYA